MEDKLSQKEKSNSVFTQKSEKRDYEDLLIRLRDIKQGIILLEKNFKFR